MTTTPKKAKPVAVPTPPVKLTVETKVTRRLIVQGHILLPQDKATIKLKGVVKGVSLSVSQKVRRRNGYSSYEYTETDSVTIPLSGLRQLAELMTALADEYAPKGITMPDLPGERSLIKTDA